MAQVGQYRNAHDLEPAFVDRVDMDYHPYRPKMAEALDEVAFAFVHPRLDYLYRGLKDDNQCEKITQEEPKLEYTNSVG